MTDSAMADVELEADVDAQSVVQDQDPDQSNQNQQRETYKRQRRLDARTWVPRETSAVVFREVEIGSQTLQRQWNLIFVTAQTAMYMLQHVVPSTGSMEQSHGIEQVLNDRMVELETALREEMQRLTHLAAGDGIDQIPAKDYTQAEKIRVPIYTPGAGSYLSLILKLDELFWMVDYLWIQGVIKPEHRWQVINSWKKKIWESVRETVNLWKRARKALNDAQREKLAKLNARRARSNDKSAAQSSDQATTAEVASNDAEAELAEAS